MSTLKTKIIQPPSDSDALTFRTNQADRLVIGADGFVNIANGTLTGGITISGELTVRGNALYMGNGAAVAPAYVIRAYGFIPATGVDTYPQSPLTTYTKNVSSITTINSQVTTVNFTTAMTTDKYTVVGMARYKGAVANQPLIFISPAYSASGYDVYANTTTSFSYTIWDNSTDSADYNYRTDVHFCIITT